MNLNRNTLSPKQVLKIICIHHPALIVDHEAFDTKHLFEELRTLVRMLPETLVSKIKFDIAKEEPCTNITRSQKDSHSLNN